MSTSINSQYQKIRFITASSLFDGHDASINIMRRILQSAGVEVIHLGHNRSVTEIVDAALQEDVHAIAVSSYQGGHVEYLKYMVDMLIKKNGAQIKIFAGGGGVITNDEIRELEDYGVTRIYSPLDGQKLGLRGLIDNMLSYCNFNPAANSPQDITKLEQGNHRFLAQTITHIENSKLNIKNENKGQAAVFGITGTGGSGKSSVTDELILRFRTGHHNNLNIAIIAVDPTRRKTGGALLGDRIRMNSINHPNIFFRSIATRQSSGELPDYLPDIISACKLSGFDLIIIETPGIGQGDAAIAPLVDSSLYVMTPEFGAQSQLEKIDMLDFADFVAINKFDRKGADDAYRDVCKQLQRNRELFDCPPDDMPVFGTTASRFNDDGLSALYQAIANKLSTDGLTPEKFFSVNSALKKSTTCNVIVPPDRVRYLAEIAQTVRDYKQNVAKQSDIAHQLQQLVATRKMLTDEDKVREEIDRLIKKIEKQLSDESSQYLQSWDSIKASNSINNTSLSGTIIPKIALPDFRDHGDRLNWLALENVPGQFPFTAGVFALKRQNEEPTRMFAGEGDAFTTNNRFKKLSEHSPAKRLSTAFDSVTLYGYDPEERPDIYGKIGNSGVSIATVDDMRALYQGFDLCHSKTSVSMTINGPAPTILAMFLNTAQNQQLEKFIADNKRQPTPVESSRICAKALQTVRGTVQADILKEDQGQNTCIFSTEFALRMMGDIQQYFVDHQIRNFYSVSISGYHIAEAGANPISQLAFTLANGFTYIETYLARGMKIDDFAANLSFFFSNGMEPEYSVLGRVARRIWAITLRDKYDANQRSQKLKYHIQTSGRSLHAQEMDFNDIRTTLQALIAVYDNCNSLHTNAFDEAITTPSEESVRRALAIQLIINREWGLAMNENPNQGAFIINELTELVEQAVLDEFDNISKRGGVLGAMETGYQRGKIQDESMLYERKKHDGSLPLIGVNTFLNPEPQQHHSIKLARSSDTLKDNQIRRLKAFQKRHDHRSAKQLKRLRHAAVNNQNMFAVLMDAVNFCSLGQITETLFEAGGKYRRNM